MNRLKPGLKTRPYFPVISGAYLLVFSALYLSSFMVMIRWWQRDDYSYCWLIPPVVIYLLWEKRQAIFRELSKPDWKGIWPLSLGVLFFWLGELGGEYYILYLSAWLMLVGICILNMGIKKVKLIGFPLAIILTMFPLPDFFNNRITLGLKLLSTQLGVTIMQAWGLSAYREGNVIDLGFTRLQVVDACSGLRYLFPLVVLAVLLAYFYKGRWWKKCLLVLSAIPLTMATNSLRIALTGLFSETWGVAAAQGFFHKFEGWLIFMATLSLLFIEMWLLNLLFKENDPEKPAEFPSHPAETNPTGEASTISPFDRPQFIVSMVVLVFTLSLSRGVEFRQAVPLEKPFDSFPMTIGQWEGKRQSMEQKIVDFLDFSDAVIVDYRDDKGHTINFYTAYYETQSKGESIHSPETCLRGGGWEFKESGPVTIALSDAGRFLRVNRSIIQQSGRQQLTYHWFPTRGRILTNAFQLKWFTFWDALIRQRTDGALVRITASIGPEETVKDAEARLQSFVRQVVPILSDHLPH